MPTEVLNKPIITELSVVTNLDKQDFQRKKIKKCLKQTTLPENDPGMMWFFHLDMAEISGDMAERWLFEELKNAFEDANNIDKTVVLHASDVAIDVESNSQQQEFDFLLFVPNRKLIVGVEVKRTFNKKNKKKPASKILWDFRRKTQWSVGWEVDIFSCIVRLQPNIWYANWNQIKQPFHPIRNRHQTMDSTSSEFLSWNTQLFSFPRTASKRAENLSVCSSNVKIFDTKCWWQR